MADAGYNPTTSDYQSHVFSIKLICLKIIYILTPLQKMSTSFFDKFRTAGLYCDLRYFYGLYLPETVQTIKRSSYADYMCKKPQQEFLLLGSCMNTKIQRITITQPQYRHDYALSHILETAQIKSNLFYRDCSSLLLYTNYLFFVQVFFKKIENYFSHF